MIIFCICLAILITTLTLGLHRRLREVEQHQRSLESSINTLAQAPLPTFELPTRPLEGLRIQISIQQDHPHPLFAKLLAERLLKEDVAEATLTETPNPAEADILIVGSLTCNGYADIYYEAEFTCATPQEPICTLIEKPPHGDRPINLAIELVTKLKNELERSGERNDRRKAIQELRET